MIAETDIYEADLDMILLDRYREEGDQESFAEIVRR